MSKAATTFYKRLAAMLSEKREIPSQSNDGMDPLSAEFQLAKSLNFMHQRGQIFCC